MPKSKFSFLEWRNGANKLRGSLQLAPVQGGPWVIFSHGFTGHRLGPSYLFVHLSRKFAEDGISSLRFDFGGCGESEGAFHDLTITSMCSDLFSATRLVRRRYAPSSIILLGHSLGGMVASLCVRDTKPDGLILLAPVGDPSGLIRRRRKLVETGPNEHGWYENGAHELSPAFLDGLRSSDPVASVMHHFRGRLLVIQGDCDDSIPVLEAGRYSLAASEAGIENSFHVIEKADHNFATVAHMKEVISVIGRWSKEHTR